MNFDNEHKSYNKYNNDGEKRTHRPRVGSYNREGGERPYRSSSYNGNGGYGDRPQRPRASQQPYNARPKRPRTANYNPNAKYSMKKQIEYKDILTDPNEPIRLNKFLANAGVCSRREADEFISAGVVSVNGEIVTELGNVERKVYVLLNKPKDCVTTSDDPQERKTVMHCVKDACKERIYPVGRLDRNTTGVLLLTNDGDLANGLLHPSNNINKVYIATIEGTISEEERIKLETGVIIDSKTTSPCEAKILKVNKEKNKTVVKLTIHEGRNHQVKKMFEAINKNVLKLHRDEFAGISSKGLYEGQYRKLTFDEVKSLKKMINNKK